MNQDLLAQRAYEAMVAPPPFVSLASSLLAADTRTKRTLLLDSADPATREAALRYLAEPEPTRERERRLEWMRADPRRVAALKHYYRHHIADFICEYGTTYDPRLIADGRKPLVPFVLFPKQRDLVAFTLARLANKEHGTVCKGRDVGATATGVATLLSLCMLEDRFAAGVGSSKEDKLDLTGAPDTIFAHADNFLAGVPEEYKGRIKRLYMRINFGNGSSFVGEAGNECGRGGRKSAYLMDEYAFHPFPVSVDGALSHNTNTVLWVSTFNGPAGPFYDKSLNAAIPRFDITWRDRPDRDEAWYNAMKARTDPVIFAQEVDANPLASREGTAIPAEWVQAAIGLHSKLGIEATGAHFAALDVADRGQDKNAFAVRHGILLQHVESWSGANSDIYGTTARAFRLCDERGLTSFDYDADGLGAGVRGDARVLNESRAGAEITVAEYRGSEAVKFPTDLVPRTDRKNEDFYSNRKAQAWWHLRMLFSESFKASRDDPYDPESIISIDPNIPELSRLTAELSQATVSQTATGKLAIDKVGDGERSPNLADAVVMAYAPRDLGWGAISSDAWDAVLSMI